MPERLSGRLELHTSREGELSIPCAGSVLSETQTGSKAVIVGDVEILEEDGFRLEAAIAALTECLTKHVPVHYQGAALDAKREGVQQAQQVSEEVHVAALAGKHVRFTSEDIKSA